ncbi:HIT family protein [Streptomyces sp. NRRL S-237]|uniref:HIT family protein n=1 Tax=Streptomyces sp. NRRL S-237 TaxID=1463895 RepID=UPI000A6C0E8A|nr:HIT family protein [Streptomyces sp. NRRL S-237]
MTSETQAPKHLATITGIETPARTGLTADGGDLADLVPAAAAALRLLADAITRGHANQDDIVQAIQDADVLAAASSAVMDETEDPYDVDHSLAADNLSGAAGQAPATIVREWPDALAIRPRTGGVTDVHVMVLLRVQVADAGADPEVTAAVYRRAAELMAELPAANLITSKGTAATQSVFHLHVHAVPRQEGDNLPLPWTPQHAARAAAQNGATS